MKMLHFMLASLLILMAIMPTAHNSAPGQPWALPAQSGNSIMPEIESQTWAFTANMGQLPDPAILFYSAWGNAAFTGDSVMLYSTSGDTVSAVKLTFPGSAGTSPEGLEPASWKSSFIFGQEQDSWHMAVPGYGRVVYRQLWEGIDLEYLAVPGGMKYQFLLGPGADPGQISVKVEGHDGLEISGSGDLVIHLGLGCEIVDSGLVAFYGDGGHETVNASFRILGHDTFTFQVEHDRARPLVIDPFVHSTFLGGSGFDSGNAVTLGEDGSPYLAGCTDSPQFPTTAGKFQASSDSERNIFVARFSPDCKSMEYLTFLGGQGYDVPHAIALGQDGSAYLTGETFSSDFPLSDNAISRAYGGVGDAFVLRLGPSGHDIIYSTYLGGRHDDAGYGIAVDQAGQAHVCGRTWSRDFSATQGSYSSAIVGDSDAFVAKISDTGDYLVYSTFLGGTGSDQASAITLDNQGNAVVAGHTHSIDFPVTGGWNSTGSGARAFASGLSISGNSLTYSIVLGGNGTDMATAITVDQNGSLHMVGSTDSRDFPLSGNASAAMARGGTDIFLCKLDAQTEKLEHSTYLGGSGQDIPTGISLDSQGRIFISGHTTSRDFITGTSKGSRDGFVLMMEQNTTGPMHSTRFSGSGSDMVLGLAVTDTGCPVVSGMTESPDFPLTLGAIAPSHNGGTDAFLAKLDITPPIAVAGPSMAVNESVVVRFNGSSSSDNDALANHTWSFNDGISPVSLFGQAPEHVFFLPGEYNVTLTVYDMAGNSNSDMLKLTVLEYHLPIARAGPDITVQFGTPARFDGTASTDRDGIVRHEWRFSGSFYNGSASGQAPEWLFPAPGNYTAELRVFDGDGNNDADSLNITVLDTAEPVALAKPISQIIPGTTVMLDATDSMDDAAVENVTWAFTHNGTAVVLHGSQANFTFWESGTHEITLTVTDGAGNSAANILAVSVSGKASSNGGLWASMALLAVSAAILVISSIRFARKRKGGGSHE